MDYSDTSYACSRHHSAGPSEHPVEHLERSGRLIRNVMGIDRREEAFRRCLPVCYRTEIDQQSAMVMEYPSGRLEQIELDDNDSFVVVRVIQE